jgi:hypothetical protein
MHNGKFEHMNVLIHYCRCTSNEILQPQFLLYLICSLFNVQNDLFDQVIRECNEHIIQFQSLIG